MTIAAFHLHGMRCRPPLLRETGFASRLAGACAAWRGHEDAGMQGGTR